MKHFFRISLLLLASALSNPARAGDILFLVEKGFNRGEFYQSYLPLKALGYDIDIASGAAGTVHLRKDDTPDERGRDIVATHALEEIQDISSYRALVIPGGYSPGFLQEMPDALRIVRAFMQRDDKPVAAVCHGPRLLLATDSLRDRVWTGLHQIPTEMPDTWAGPKRGTYLDQQVVTDGDLITARYPQDTPALARALIRNLADKGGPGLPDVTGSYVMLTPGAPSRHIAWALRDPLNTLGFDVFAEDGLTPDIALKVEGVIAFRTPEGGIPDLPNLGTLPLHVLDVPDEPFGYPDLLPGLLAFATEHGTPITTEAQPAADAVLALTDGFDDRVASATRALAPL